MRKIEISEKIENMKLEVILEENITARVAISEKAKVPCFRGCIDAKTLSDISISYNPSYLDEVENAEEKLVSTVKGILYHEHGHKTVCPRTLNNHEILLNVVAEVLKEKKKYSGFACADMLNAFEDLVDNTKCAFDFGCSGEFLFYDDCGRHSKKFNDYFEAFVRTQMAIYGNKNSKKVMNKYYTNSKKSRQAVVNFLKRTGINSITASFSTNKSDVLAKDREKITNYIANPKNWKELARIFTEEFSELIEPGIPFYSIQMGTGEGEGEFSLDENDKMEGVYRRYKGKNEKLDGEDDFEFNDEDSKYKGETDLSKSHAGKFNPPSYIDRYEALDLLYKRLAKNLDIKVSANTKSEQMPMSWFGKKKHNENETLSRIKFGFDEKGNVILTSPKYHVDMPVEYHLRPDSFPQINFVMLDTSGSMQSPVSGKGHGKIMNPWDDGGRHFSDTSAYHYAILSWYGLLEFLRKNGNLKRDNVKFANFSNRTILSKNLKDAKKSAFSPQFGGTELDMKEVNSVFENKEMLTLSLSDGQISNWDNIKKEFVEKAKQNYFVHIQIGASCSMTKDLEEAGLPVVYDRGENLPKIIIDLTNTYLKK